MIFQKRVDWPLVIFCLALIVAVVMAALTVARSAAEHRAMLRNDAWIDSHHRAAIERVR